MKLYVLLLLLNGVYALNLDYLDPVKLQTFTPISHQKDAATKIISKYLNTFSVEVDTSMFTDNKDAFSLKTTNGTLYIKASTGVAAVWGFNYYLKKYCKSQIAWQVKRVKIPVPLPDVDETVVANDRFRYYQNVCTASYSFVWWGEDSWKNHVDWMALNGINLVLAPVPQELHWSDVYKEIGMTDDEINDYFTGPAFLSWLRMGNVHGWGGPLPQSWHDKQWHIRYHVVSYMFDLGIVPIFPAFNGHVPKAFERIYPNTTFYTVEKWNRFGEDFCCGLFLDPTDPLFKTIGKMFLKQIDKSYNQMRIFTADPFNEVKLQVWSTGLTQSTAKAIYETISEYEPNAVWLVQNWMFFTGGPLVWPIERVKSFITSVPSGRMLLLDLQSEQWPQYHLYDMYYGQPFIWCMLHNFGGTLGMFGNMITINKEVYEARMSTNSTMIGIGLTPEGINQNYVVYDLMLESAWRRQPVEDLEVWAGEYAERRYGCNATTDAWKFLLKSVYSFDGLNMMRGKYVITRRPSFKIKPWAWYRSHDLFEAFKKFAFVDDPNCKSDGFYHDLVDVTRQALQYRAEQLYINILENRMSTSWVFNATINQFLDAMSDMETILSAHYDFSAIPWLYAARSIATNDEEKFIYELNSRNQITMWGPNGEISDYACKQWAELFHYYYIPRWSTFLNAALDAKIKNEMFDEKRTQSIIRSEVEEKFLSKDIDSRPPSKSIKDLAVGLYEKWSIVPGLQDLPLNILRASPDKMTTFADVDTSREDVEEPTVIMLATTPTL